MGKEIIEIVQNRLRKIEKEHSVKILYAIESGSRAWGFESIDSDYDIRFIYAHKKNWYLNILPKRDVIEYPIIKEPPPMEFEKLLTLVKDDELLGIINGLLKRKKSGIELGIEQKIPKLNVFIEEALKHFENTVNSFDPRKKPNQQLLEEGFIKIVEYCEGL